VVPDLKKWSDLPLIAPKSMEKILKLLADTNNKATFFWLGWMAERMPETVKKCHAEGHEIASHGYAHILAFKSKKNVFKEDIKKAKNILEDIIGEPIRGFRAPGFSITENEKWAFDVIKEVGYEYDSSIFPAKHGHGGIANSKICPHIIRTNFGELAEVPLSVIDIFGKRINLFGGGYLRLATKYIIKFGIKKLRKNNQPFIVYLHPREIDPNHPRLPLNLFRKFKCYVNLKSTMPKLEWLCNSYTFSTMSQLVAILQLDALKKNMYKTNQYSK
jgi:polysaccharide deacetylase family protein (PEP-CTERM system associated)